MLYNFYNDLEELCASHNITLTVLLLDIGVPTKSATSWENGVEPSPEILRKITERFGVPANYFSPKTRALEPAFLYKLSEEDRMMHPDKIVEKANAHIDAISSKLDDIAQKGGRVIDLLRTLSSISKELPEDKKREFDTTIKQVGDIILAIIYC
jgi:transcriptional regulator with XRE-family HTH domain